MTVTVADLKKQLNIEHDEDDAFLSKKIASSMMWIESFTGTPIPVETPADMDEAILQLAANLYQSRGTEEGAEIPQAVYSLVGRYVKWAC